jgi:hypothetical protein
VIVYLHGKMRTEPESLAVYTNEEFLIESGNGSESVNTTILTVQVTEATQLEVRMIDLVVLIHERLAD